MAIKLNALEQYPTLDDKTLFFIRLLDLIGAGIGLVLLSPLFFIVGTAIKLLSPGSIFYGAERVGRQKRSVPAIDFARRRWGPAPFIDD